MDIYHVWCDLKEDISDIVFADVLTNFLGHLQAQDKIHSFRITRRKLGLGPSDLGDFHIMIETENLAQLDAAFQHIATRAGDVETQHFSVNALVRNARFALYRDFPDPFRVRGEEKF